MERPLTPLEYAKKYRDWDLHLHMMEEVLTCICQACIVCLVIRPNLLQMEFPDEVLNPPSLGSLGDLDNEDMLDYDEEYPEDDYDEEE